MNTGLDEILLLFPRIESPKSWDEDGGFTRLRRMSIRRRESRETGATSHMKPMGKKQTRAIIIEDFESIMNHFFGFGLLFVAMIKATHSKTVVSEWMQYVFFFFFSLCKGKGKGNCISKLSVFWVPQKDENFHTLFKSHLCHPFCTSSKLAQINESNLSTYFFLSFYLVFFFNHLEIYLVYQTIHASEPVKLIGINPNM